MGYLSFDASVKIHLSGRFTSTKTKKSGNGGIRGYIRHIDRVTDKKNGCEVQHSNDSINSDLTLNNESYYKDENGEWKQTATSKDILESVNRRIDYAKSHGARLYEGGKNDTTIVRPLLIQLDEETVHTHPNWREDAIQILEDKFGKENIVAVCVHKDETNAHLHVVFTPVDEVQDVHGNIKCSVSQTKFFKSPKALAGMHKEIRRSLQSKGYEIELENKPIEEQLAGYYDKNGEWHQQGLTPDQLKQLSDRTIHLYKEGIELKLRKEELDRLEATMRQMQDSAREKQDRLNREKAEYEEYKNNQMAILDSQRRELASDLEEYKRQLELLNSQKQEVQRMKAEANEMLEEIYNLSDTVKEALTDNSDMNEKFLKYCDRVSEKTNQPFRQIVDSLYRGFRKEQQSKLTEWQKSMLRERRIRTGKPVTPDVPIYCPPIVKQEQKDDGYQDASFSMF